MMIHVHVVVFLLFVVCRIVKNLSKNTKIWEHVVAWSFYFFTEQNILPHSFTMPLSLPFWLWLLLFLYFICKLVLCSLLLILFYTTIALLHWYCCNIKSFEWECLFWIVLLLYLCWHICSWNEILLFWQRKIGMNDVVYYCDEEERGRMMVEML